MALLVEEYGGGRDQTLISRRFIFKFTVMQTIPRPFFGYE